MRLKKDDIIVIKITDKNMPADIQINTAIRIKERLQKDLDIKNKIICFNDSIELEIIDKDQMETYDIECPDCGYEETKELIQWKTKSWYCPKCKKDYKICWKNYSKDDECFKPIDFEFC